MKVLTFLKILFCALLAGIFLFFIHIEWKKVASHLHFANISEFFKVDPRKIENKAKTITINQLIPSFENLITLNSDPQKDRAGLFNLLPYTRYYERLAEYNMQIGESQLILGFCYFYEGKEEMALTAFEKAAELNPSLFWAKYNLGVIYFKKEDYKKASAYLNAAATIKPDVSLQEMLNSKVYQQIFFILGSDQRNDSFHLKEGYKNSLVLLSLIQSLWQNENISSELIRTSRKFPLYIF